jgi:leader peptidase (prepilin peptidase)/N-methyltransferase
MRCSTSAAELLPLLRDGLFFSLMILASVLDIRTRIIPNSLCAGIAASGLILFEPHQLLGILTALPFLIVALTKPGGVGGGDIKFMAAVGFCLGLEGGLTAAIVGLTAYLLFFAFYSAVQGIRKRERLKAFPLVPFLSVGCTIAYFGGLTR